MDFSLFFSGIPAIYREISVLSMKHFEAYLRGRHFTLFTNHQPLEKLGAVHNKTLNWLQEAMLEIDFEIV